MPGAVANHEETLKQNSTGLWNEAIAKRAYQHTSIYFIASGSTQTKSLRYNNALNNESARLNDTTFGLEIQRF